jgi:hypothetical protein
VLHYTIYYTPRTSRSSRALTFSYRQSPPPICSLTIWSRSHLQAPSVKSADPPILIPLLYLSRRQRHLGSDLLDQHPWCLFVLISLPFRRFVPPASFLLSSVFGRMPCCFWWVPSAPAPARAWLGRGQREDVYIVWQCRACAYIPLRSCCLLPSLGVHFFRLVFSSPCSIDASGSSRPAVPFLFSPSPRFLKLPPLSHQPISLSCPVVLLTQSGTPH